MSAQRARSLLFFAVVGSWFINPIAFADLSRSKVPTQKYVAYLGRLVEKRVVTPADLKRIVEHHATYGALTNPILKSETYFGFKGVHRQEFEKRLERGGLDAESIVAWAKLKLGEQGQVHAERREVQHETVVPFEQMTFVRLPAGRFVSPVDAAIFIAKVQGGQPTDHPLEVAARTELQSAPVTQFQWASVMHHNPAINYRDADELLAVDIGGQLIRMMPDAPINNVSTDDIREFIGKLNQRDTQYEYDFPNFDEWLCAFTNAGRTNPSERDLKTYCIQAAREHRRSQNPVENIKQLEPFLVDGQPIWDLGGNVQELTQPSRSMRDRLQQRHPAVRLPEDFHRQRIELHLNLLLPPINDRSWRGYFRIPEWEGITTYVKRDDLGFRLVRRPKAAVQP